MCLEVSRLEKDADLLGGFTHSGCDRRLASLDVPGSTGDPHAVHVSGVPQLLEEHLRPRIRQT